MATVVDQGEGGVSRPFSKLTDKQLVATRAKYQRLWANSGAIAYGIHLDRIDAEQKLRAEQVPA